MTAVYSQKILAVGSHVECCSNEVTDSSLDRWTVFVEGFSHLQCVWRELPPTLTPQQTNKTKTKKTNKKKKATKAHKEKRNTTITHTIIYTTRVSFAGAFSSRSHPSLPSFLTGKSVINTLWSVGTHLNTQAIYNATMPSTKAASDHFITVNGERHPQGNAIPYPVKEWF